MSITLGKLIAHLELENPNDEVEFDFCGAAPTRFASYRGDYSELALGHDITGAKPQKVSDLLAAARGCIGKTFEGYKGGDFIMHPHTPVRVDNWGEWTSTHITGVESGSGTVILVTRKVTS